MSPTRHFCCCLPVRLGTFVLSFGSILVSGTYAATIWYAIYMANNKKEANLDKPQEVAFVVAGSIYTFLFVLSIFGFLGAVLRKRSFVSAYAQAMWYMVGFQLAAGAFFIYTLYRQKQVNIDKCVEDLKAANPSLNIDFNKACSIATKTWKVIYIVVFVISLLLHGYAALIVSRYVEQLSAEQAYRHTAKGTHAAFSTSGSGAAYYPHHPLGQSTDQLTQHHEGKSEYPYAAPQNSYGHANV